MKVLWFSNTPAGAEEELKISATRGGWLISLEKAIKAKVELSVAFYFARYAEYFESDGVKYYPVCRKNWKLNIIRNKIFGDYIDREDLPVYLDIIDKVKPDIIHIHGTENPFGCIIGETEIPVVVSIQGNYTVCTHKYFSGIERKYTSLRGVDIRSPNTWLDNKSRIRRHRISSVPKTKREQRNLFNCRNIIGRTDWDRRISRILSARSRYFHNDEILRDSFYQKKWASPGNDKIIVHTTTGGAIFKGFETVCQALNELLKIGIDIEWRIAGIPKNSWLDKVVKKMLKDSYPSKGLILLGNLQEPELVSRMLEADIYVMPSHIENSPNSLCEAMIMGMPCISTLAGGSSTILKDKEEGLIIQDGDPWSMAGAILELASDREQAVRYGEKAREKALIRHNKDKIVSDLMVIYRTIDKK
jgi:glycosyltransferase involved in cell wall biosynthesis